MGDTSVTVGVAVYLLILLGLYKQTCSSLFFYFLNFLIVSYQEAALVIDPSSSSLIFFSCVGHCQASSLVNLWAACNDATGIKNKMLEIGWNQMRV